MKINDTEVEVRLSDLFAGLLKAFKLILCLALVFALLGGAFGVYKTIDSAKHPSVTEDDIKAAEKAVEKAEDRVKANERSLENLFNIEIPDAETKIVRAEQLLQRRQEYLDNSLYYAMNPFHRGVSRVTLFVDTETEVNPSSPWMTVNPQSSIVIAYTKIYPFDSEILENVKRIMDTDADLPYINELISVSNVSNQFVEICVYHDDADVAKEVTDYLLETLQERLSSSVGDYSANVVGYFVGYEVDWSMNDSHNTNDDRLLSAERALDNAKEDLEKLNNETREAREQAIEDAKTALDDAKKNLNDLNKKYSTTSAEPKNIVKQALKKALVFLAVGLFLGCFGVLVRYFMSGRIQSINTVVSRYSFPVLGILPCSRKRWFEKSIRKLEGEPDTDFESAGNAAAESIATVVGAQKVAYVSSEGAAEIEKILPFTGELLPVCGDILKDPKAVKAAGAYDAFVLVEERGRSRVALIDSEVRRIASLGKDVKGIVLF